MFEANHLIGDGEFAPPRPNEQLPVFAPALPPCPGHLQSSHPRAPPYPNRRTFSIGILRMNLRSTKARMLESRKSSDTEGQPQGPATPTQHAKRRRLETSIVLDDVPDEILYHIVRMADSPRDLCALACASKRFKEIVQVRPTPLRPRDSTKSY